MKKNYNLGNFICELREDAGMDQKTLATLLGVSPSAISQCENGGGIKTEKLFQLSELFGVTLDELLSGKRAEQPIEERLDDLYYIDEDELSQAVNKENYGRITKIFQRIKIVRERFEELIYKRIFAKVTKDENTELEYLIRYYSQQIYNSKYFEHAVGFFNDEQRYGFIKETLLNAIGNNKRNALMWELNKIFLLKLNLHLQEIISILAQDDRIETEQAVLECLTAVFDALPSLSNDLFFSQLAYYDNCFYLIKLPLIKNLIGQGARLLYLPTVKNKSTVDENIISALDGKVEYDQRLTDAVEMYKNNFINGFDYKDFIRLTYDEYQSCINEEGTQDLLQLSNLWQGDKIAYWDKFKTVKIYRNK